MSERRWECVMKKIIVIAICFLLPLYVIGCSKNLSEDIYETDVTASDEEFVLNTFLLEPERILSENPYTNGRVFNTDFSLIAIPNANGNIYIQELETQEIIATVETSHTQTIMDVVFSESDECVAVIFENWVEVYDIASNQKVCEAEFPQKPLYVEFIKQDKYLIIATGSSGEDGIVCHYNCGIRASEAVDMICTIDIVDDGIIHVHQLETAEYIYGITDDDMYICTDGGENYVASYSCFSDEVLYNFTDVLYQNASFYPFDQNGEYYIYEQLNEDFFKIFSLANSSVVYETESIYSICFLGSNQVSYKLEDGTTVLYDFIEDVEIARIPLTAELKSQTIYQNITGTDQYVGFDSTDIYTSRYFIYDLSENIKYASTSSFQPRAGMTMYYYLEDKTLFLYGDSYGWNCEVYHYLDDEEIPSVNLEQGLLVV